jgi:DNA topoisomerase-3
MRVSLRRLEEAIMRVLNLAEKNDAAKNNAAQLSNGTARMVGWFFLFELNIFNQRCQIMIMTSVSGHLLALEYPPAFQKVVLVSARRAF